MPVMNEPTSTDRRDREPTYGKCTACGSVEVVLNKPSGTTAIEGECDRYPVGYGCELCD